MPQLMQVESFTFPYARREIEGERLLISGIGLEQSPANVGEKQLYLHCTLQATANTSIVTIFACTTGSKKSELIIPKLKYIRSFDCCQTQSD